MFALKKSLRCCSAYLRGTANFRHTSNRSSAGGRCRELKRQPTALIVDHRDEFFDGLEAFFESVGVRVGRAESGAAVAAAICRFPPDLAIIHENVADESGWLISCKLRLRRFWQPIWVYADKKPLSQEDWKELSGVDEVIEYGGLLSGLLWQLQPICSSWLDAMSAAPDTRSRCLPEYFRVAS